jgi:Domain of unknown function (DUF4142)
MFSTIALVLFYSGTPAEATTLARRPAPEQIERQRSGESTDPLFDKAPVATDDQAFVLSAVESARQGTLDARNARQVLQAPQLKNLAQRIEKQNSVTLLNLESIAKRKGWRLPTRNPDRDQTSSKTDPHLAGANFIVSQISYHEATVAQYKAQLKGAGDRELRHAISESVGGYEQNLRLLLTVKP